MFRTRLARLVLLIVLGASCGCACSNRPSLFGRSRANGPDCCPTGGMVTTPDCGCAGTDAGVVQGPVLGTPPGPPPGNILPPPGTPSTIPPANIQEMPARPMPYNPNLQSRPFTKSPVNEVKNGKD